MAYKFLSIMGTVPVTATDADLDGFKQKGEDFLKSIGIAGSVSISDSEDVKAPDSAAPAA